MCYIQKRGRAGLVLSLLGVFMICISAGRMAYAEGCLQDAAASGTILVDATSSCEALGQKGCSVDNDSGTCSFDSTGEVLSPNADSTTVTIDPNTNSKFDGINWYSSGKYTINWVIINGAAQGGACGYVYEPGKTESLGNALGNILGYEKSNGSVQSVNSVEVCSKLELPDAKLVVNKTVTADGNCENGSDLLEIIIDRDPPQGETVTYCYEISNTGSGDAFDVQLVDDNAGIGDPYPLSIGNLPAGATVRSWVDYPDDVNDVVLTERGTYINTATVTGDSDNGTVSASDTATVETGVAAEQCPQAYQDLINALNVDTDNFYAASILLEPKNPGLISLCTPTCSNDPGNPNYVEGVDCPVAESTRTLCEDDCVWDNDLDSCTPSGNWDPDEEDVIDPDGRMPYCWEVLESITDGGGVGLKVKSSQTVEIIELSTNPYVYQTCYKSGGRKVCETICYLYDGESGADCPKGSTIY